MNSAIVTTAQSQMSYQDSQRTSELSSPDAYPNPRRIWLKIFVSLSIIRRSIARAMSSSIPIAKVQVNNSLAKRQHNVLKRAALLRAGRDT